MHNRYRSNKLRARVRTGAHEMRASKQIRASVPHTHRHTRKLPHATGLFISSWVFTGNAECARDACKKLGMHMDRVVKGEYVETPSRTCAQFYTAAMSSSRLRMIEKEGEDAEYRDKEPLTFIIPTTRANVDQWHGHLLALMMRRRTARPGRPASVLDNLPLGPLRLDCINKYPANQNLTISLYPFFLQRTTTALPARATAVRPDPLLSTYCL